jgi:hypothetical protein
VPKPTYKTFVVERHVDRPRALVWPRVATVVADGDDELVSFEPPWRRVGRLHEPSLGLVEHTVALRDDGDSCHLVWAYLAEVPSADDLPADVQEALDRLRSTVTAWADRAATA